MFKMFLKISPYILLAVLYCGFFAIAVEMESPDLCGVFSIFLVISIVYILINKIKNH